MARGNLGTGDLGSLDPDWIDQDHRSKAMRISHLKRHVQKIRMEIGVEVQARGRRPADTLAVRRRKT
jgi:hypothetical protein